MSGAPVPAPLDFLRYITQLAALSKVLYHLPGFPAARGHVNSPEIPTKSICDGDGIAIPIDALHNKIRIT
jgi:hypothetical protein